MDNSIWLVVGLGSIAFVIGYLAGGSKSPVVSAMIAGIFGLVTVSTGMITGSDLVKKLDEVRAGVVAHSKDNAAFQKTLDDIKNGLQKPSASGSGASSPSDAKIDEVTKNIGAAKTLIAANIETNSATQKTLNDINDKTKQTPYYVGIALTVFAVLFMFGAFTGTMARADEWFRPKRKFPWATGSAPTTTADSISWLAVQEKLLGFGYTRNEVQALYKSWMGVTNPEAMQSILTSLGGLPAQPVDVPPLSLIANVQKTS